MSPFRASIAELKASTFDGAARFIAERPALVIGGASAIAGALLLVAGVIFLVASSPPPAVEIATIPAAAPPSAPPPPTATARPELGSPELPPAQLSITANAPIARVRVGRRVIDIEVAAPRVAVELTPEEAEATLAVVATSTDGRTVTATSRPGAADVSVTFAERPPPRGGPRKKR